MGTVSAPQRLAVVADAERIRALMRTSARELFPRFYDARQSASAVVHIAQLDMWLIEDGTYFVHEANGELVACGGWSRRAKLYADGGDQPGDERLLDPAAEPARVRGMFVRGDWTRRGLGRAILASCERAARAEGFQSLVLMATLPGEPLYRAFGFEEVARSMVAMPDGVETAAIEMRRPIRQLCEDLGGRGERGPPTPTISPVGREVVDRFEPLWRAWTLNTAGSGRGGRRGGPPSQLGDPALARRALAREPDAVALLAELDDRVVGHWSLHFLDGPDRLLCHGATHRRFRVARRAAGVPREGRARRFAPRGPGTYRRDRRARPADRSRRRQRARAALSTSPKRSRPLMVTSRQPPHVSRPVR